MKTFKKGYDGLDNGADFITYQIDVTYDSKYFRKNYANTHYGQIFVFGDEDMRDEILAMLQEKYSS